MQVTIIVFQSIVRTNASSDFHLTMYDTLPHFPLGNIVYTISTLPTDASYISLSPSTTHSFLHQNILDSAPFTISSLQIDVWA